MKDFWEEEDRLSFWAMKWKKEDALPYPEMIKDVRQVLDLLTLVRRRLEVARAENPPGKMDMG